MRYLRMVPVGVVFAVMINHGLDWMFARGPRHGTASEVVGYAVMFALLGAARPVWQTFKGEQPRGWLPSTPLWIIVPLSALEAALSITAAVAMSLPLRWSDLTVVGAVAGLSAVWTLGESRRAEPVDSDPDHEPAHSWSRRMLVRLGFCAAAGLAPGIAVAIGSVRSGTESPAAAYAIGLTVGIVLAVSGFAVVAGQSVARRTALRQWRVQTDIVIWGLGFGVLAAGMHAATHDVLPWYAAGAINVGAVALMAVSDAVAGPYERYADRPSDGPVEVVTRP